MWLLAATTRGRRGELAGLRASDVDFRHGRVTPSAPRVSFDGQVRESETEIQAGHRSMALDPTTLSALRAYVDGWEVERRMLGQDSRLLFVWPDGTPLHPDTMTSLFRRHTTAAGLPTIRLHDLRHSYATAALKSGISPKIVSERPGHTNVAFTKQTYMHIIPGMDEQAANEVASLILGADGLQGPGLSDILEEAMDADMDAGDEK